MDPNSSHQLWSRWTATIEVPFHVIHTTDAFAREMRAATSRVYRALFGSATELKIDRELIVASRMTRIVVDCRTEGAPAPDRAFRKRQMNELSRFFATNLRQYGEVNVHIDIRVEAGDVGDGKPRAQLILGPPIALMPRAKLFGR